VIIQAARLKKQEKFLRTQIVSIKDDLRLRKQIDEDGALVPKSVLKMFVTMPDPDSESDLDSDDNDDADSDEEARGFDLAEGVSYDEQEEMGAAMGDRVRHSNLRKSFLEAGIPATLLSLDTEALPPNALDLPRLMNEVVATPYHGEFAYMYAMKPPPSSDANNAQYDTSEIVARIELLGELCQGSTPTLCGFAGATDVEGHVILAVSSPRGASLKRICRSLSDGDVKVSSLLQVALAQDITLAVARLHSAGIVHGNIGVETMVVSLHQPCTATLLFMGSSSSSKTEADDIFDLGLVFVTLALGFPVTSGSLPTASDLREAAQMSETPPLESFVELSVQMTQGASSMRPTCSEVVDWLQAIVDEDGLPDAQSVRVLQPNTARVGTVATIYELQRDASPLRRF
jgi:hypothetical protein